VGLRDLIYSLYERRIAAKLVGKPLPAHVGVIVDGNRRWAREMGYVDPNDGHRVGAVRIRELLSWCDQAGIAHVTLWLLSTDNLGRPASELDPLLQIIEDLAGDLAEDGNPWRLHMVGALDLLPAALAESLKSAEERTIGRTGGAQVNIAVGYGGRREIADAVRSLLHEHAKAGTSIEELAEIIDADHIADHLYTRGQPDPDLLIRTSGELRISNFLLWQAAYSEIYVTETLWPDFRRAEMLEAVIAYQRRDRRFGGLKLVANAK
jgi:short-chain Z-isoprenyl diphosphate synthase